jgi:hypothetical protein
MAAPVTADDLAGKRICWSDGTVETYSRDGTMSGTDYGEGTWKITGTQFQIKYKKYKSAVVGDFQKLDNGTFTYSGILPEYGKWTGTGTYCK